MYKIHVQKGISQLASPSLTHYVLITSRWNWQRINTSSKVGGQGGRENQSGLTLGRYNRSCGCNRARLSLCYNARVIVLRGESPTTLI